MILFSVVLAIVLVFLILRKSSELSHIREELSALQAKLAKLEQTVSHRLSELEKRGTEQNLSSTPSQPADTMQSATVNEESRSAPSTTEKRSITYEVKSRESSRPTVVITRVKPKEPVHQRTSAEWEALIGGKLLNRIGAIAIVLAAVFFFKYAIDNNWITPWLRILIGIVAGVGLIGFAERNRNRGYAVFAQGLLAAGIAIEYFTIFAAHDFYDLIPTGVEFFGLCCVTVVTLFFAVLFDSIAVVYLGWAGGFLTPFMLHLTMSNPLGSLIYLIVFSGSLLILTRQKRAWWTLEFFSKGGVFLGYFILYNQSFVPASRMMFLFFVVVAWALYHVNDLFRSPEHDKPNSITRHIMQAVNALFILVAVSQLLYQYDRTLAGIVFFVIACAYAFSSVYISPEPDEKSELWKRETVGVVFFLTVAMVVYFKGFIAISIVSLEALVLFLWCAKKSVKTIAYVTLVILLFALLKYCITKCAFEWTPVESFVFLLNLRTVALLLLAGAMVTTFFSNRKFALSLSKEVMNLVAIGVGVTLFTWFTVETADIFKQRIYSLDQLSPDVMWWKNIEQLTLSGVWLVFSMVAMGIGLWRRVRGLRIAAIAVFGVTILKIFILDLSFLTTFYRMLSFFGLGVILLLVSFLYQKYKYVILPPAEKNIEPVVEG